MTELGRGVARGARVPLDGASAVPAGWAALAEAGVLFLPVQEVVREVIVVRTGPLVAWPAFLVLFVAGVMAATALRRSRRTTTVLIAASVAVGLLQTFAWSRGDPAAAVGLSTVALLVGVRVATLAAREWRDPISGSIAVGAIVLLIEVAIAPGAPRPWPQLIGPVVVLFFAGSLASRAASVRIEETGRARAPFPEELRTPGSAARVAVPALAVVSLVLALTWLGGGQHGALRYVGIGAGLAVGGVLLATTWVLSPIAIVLGWIAGLLHLDLLGFLRRGLRRLPNVAAMVPHTHGRESILEQLLRFVSLLAVSAFLILLIHRRRRRRFAPIARRPVRDEAIGTVSVQPGGGGPRRHFGLRRELPEVTVRRFYAEALLALERRALPKPDHLTPAEFLPAVCMAFPAVRSAFEELTHAYEDVRYGDREITQVRVARLRERRPVLLETLRIAERADLAEVGEPSSTGENGRAPA